MTNRILRSIFERMQETERRAAASQWTGKVKQVDAQKHLIRVVLGKDDDGAEVLSPWMPISQPAGALKLHSMPSVGQVMSVRTEGGDIEQGVAHPYHWTDENPSPSQDAGEHKLTFGSVTITLTSGGLKLEAGGTQVDITGAGVEVQADSFPITGSTLTHNSKNISHTHKHINVETGSSVSGPPE